VNSAASRGCAWSDCSDDDLHARPGHIDRQAGRRDHRPSAAAERHRLGARIERVDRSRRPRQRAPSAQFAARYRLTFEVGDYFEARGVESFYSKITIDFLARDASHYHVPLLLSPYGYSTYRGS
jgi:hypothetical protein